MSVETNSHNYTNMNLIYSQFVAAEFPKTPSLKSARIPPQTPPAGGKSAEAKRKILSPRKIDFRLPESVLKPHALPEYLEGRTPKKNVLSIFKKKFTPAKSKKQETFFFGVAGVLASAWGFLRIIYFENRFELGKKNTIKNASVAEAFLIAGYAKCYSMFFCNSANRSLACEFSGLSSITFSI